MVKLMQTINSAKKRSLGHRVYGHSPMPAHDAEAKSAPPYFKHN